MTAPARPAAPRRAQLLQVATTLFFEKGYPHTTLQDIADRMGFTKAAVYYYAKNKEELLVEIYTGIVLPALADARTIAQSDAADGATRFSSLVANHLGIFLQNIEANAVFEVQHSSLSAPARTRVQALAREYTEVLLAVYEAGVADGSIRPGHPAIVVNAVVGLCNSVHRWYRPTGRFTAPQVADELLALVDAAVRRPPAPGHDDGR